MTSLLLSYSAQVTVSSTSTAIVSFIVAILMVIAQWRIFDKAREAGWKSLIPLYNGYILAKIVFGNGLYFFLTIIPCVNFIFLIFQQYKLSKAFGHGAGFTVGLILCAPIFTLILAFEENKYLGPQ